MVALPERYAPEPLALTAEARAKLDATLSLIDAALSGDPVRTLAGRLTARLGAEPIAELCREDDSAFSHGATDGAALAGYLLLRVVADGPALDRGDDYYRAVIEQARSAAGHAAPLSSSARSAVDTLLRELRALQGLQSQLAARGALAPAELVERARHLASLTGALLTIALDRPFVLPAQAPEFVTALLEARLGDALASGLQLTQALSGKGPSAAAADAAGTAVRFALARDEDEAKRIVRGLIVPLGRWSESVLFDLNGDIPQLASGAFKLVGDAMLGYNGRSWGVAARGSYAEYDFSTANVISETTAADGTLDTWLVLGSTSAWRFELRFVARAALYDTNKSNAGFADETSVMGRGALLGSVRYQPNERAAFGLWLGGGAQYESYDNGQYVSKTATINDTENVGLLLNGRLRAEYAIIPRYVATRVRVDAQRFQLTRQSMNTVAGGGTVVTTGAALTATQLEVHARLFLDAEVARVGGFVPSLNGGFDSITFSSSIESHSAFVPVFGAGVRRETF